MRERGRRKRKEKTEMRGKENQSRRKKSRPAKRPHTVHAER
jgi:hypothetical protein